MQTLLVCKMILGDTRLIRDGPGRALTSCRLDPDAGPSPVNSDEVLPSSGGSSGLTAQEMAGNDQAGPPQQAPLMMCARLSILRTTLQTDLHVLAFGNVGSDRARERGPGVQLGDGRGAHGGQWLPRALCPKW